MDFSLTIHNQQRLQQRRLPIHLLQLVIEAPEQVVEERGASNPMNRGGFHPDAPLSGGG